MRHALFAVGAALLVARVAVACVGWRDVSPADAYDLEVRSCRAKPGAEEQRRCLALVERKYGRYLGNGAYPESWSPGVR
jgi:hypothetical protein